MPLGKVYCPNLTNLQKSCYLFFLIQTFFYRIYKVTHYSLDFKKFQIQNIVGLKNMFLLFLDFLKKEKKRLETRLNRGYPFLYSQVWNASNHIDLHSDLNNTNKDNSVSNQIQPRRQPGLYMIRCKVNDMRYYGESQNVSGRLSSHKSLLKRKIHPNFHLQHDWNTFGVDSFEFIVLFMGSQWKNREERLAKETLLIIQDRQLCYNYLEGQSRPAEQNPFWGRRHTDESKKKIGDAMRGIPNNKLGKAIQLDGVIYPSIAEASRETNHSRKFIRKRLQNANDSGCTEI